MKSLLKSNVHLLLMMGLVFTISSVFTSCSKDNEPTPSSGGSLGEISVNRTNIGAWQSFTLTCQYTPGKNIVEDEIMCGLYVLEAVNGKISYTVQGVAAGTYTFKFQVRSIGQDAQIHNEEKSITVTVSPTDIRNNYWGDTVDETWNNLSNYSTRQRVGQDHIAITEKDCWGSNLNYSTELTSFSGTSTMSFENNRIVSYSFENNKLQRISYQIELSAESDLVKALTLRAKYYENFDAYKVGVYDSEENSSFTLSESEKELATLFTEGKQENDPEHLLSKAIVEKGLKLYLIMESDKNNLLFSLEEDNGKIYLHTFFVKK